MCFWSALFVKQKMPDSYSDHFSPDHRPHPERSFFTETTKTTKLLDRPAESWCIGSPSIVSFFNVTLSNFSPLLDFFWKFLNVSNASPLQFFQNYPNFWRHIRTLLRFNKEEP